MVTQDYSVRSARRGAVGHARHESRSQNLYGGPEHMTLAENSSASEPHGILRSRQSPSLVG
jgi:hypothetical protein